MMRQLHHTNVLALHVSFVHKQNLWMVEPFVAGGSMLNIMKYAYREVRRARARRASRTCQRTCRMTSDLAPPGEAEQ